ncbi:Crp/Fnr family transcriptional regulator [Polaromonas sp.]|uniref:Crp/Fnr family transcriptional regulator n=1 Tax=Polaromonas sp. TaxID=1869339 RepID=UPI00184A5D39|nr:cyclic nucleotide-binding domain-containing protein [Polaromonas sp.]NML84512.1 cyclic nucleotide-binding domain-containing protein [Polaromonas sp.]
MNVLMPAVAPSDIQGLVRAIAHCSASDALRCQFSQPHWDILGAHMQPFALNQGQVLMEQGTLDRTLYVIESGNLSVHYEDKKSRVRMALVGAGTVLGEGSFFSHQPRSASVHASTPCKLWCLTPIRFTELASRHSPIALELTLALGSVMARRLYLRPRRVAVT